MKIKALFFVLLLATTSFVIYSCNDEDEPAGPEETCTDGILNQDEVEIDCGGVCPPCPEDTGITANVGGLDWAAISIDATVNGGTLTIYTYNSAPYLWLINLVHKGEFKTGTYNLDPTTYLQAPNGDNYAFTSGEITFTKFNTSTKTLSGTFHYKTQGPSVPVDVTEGKFDNIVYK